jgi:hypothetical protein
VSQVTVDPLTVPLSRVQCGLLHLHGAGY